MHSDDTMDEGRQFPYFDDKNAKQQKSEMMKATLSTLLQTIPGPKTEKWPDGERFAKALSHGTMSVEVYAPVNHDSQTPHAQDELYFVMRGMSEFVLEESRMHLGAGDAVFVPAGAVHRFERFSDDFVTWVVFWGPPGGERSNT